MAAKQDLVLGAVSGLDWVDIEVWAHSLTQSGFSGIRAMIVYGDSPQVVANLKAMGFQVLERPLLGTIWNHRFRDFHDVVRASADDLRYCVITDVRDVYFQTDPTAWLERNLTKPMLAASESIRFRDEVWNRTNFEIAFPDLAGRLNDLPVYNVGVLAGEARTIADLTLAIALTAKAAGADVADQAAYNLLLDMEPYRSACQFTRQDEGFACQAGAIADPRRVESYRPYLLEAEPIFDAEGIKTPGGELFALVHQYDRIQPWHDHVRATINQRLAGA